MSRTADRHDGRRSFLARLGLFAGIATLGTPPLHAAPRPNEPLVHKEDAWMDALPSGHRIVFDAVSMAGASSASRFCGNWIRSHDSGYGVKPEQLGALIVLRAPAAPFALVDAMWVKYPQLGALVRSPEPATGKPWTRNPFLAADGPAQGSTWPELTALGVHFIVCKGTLSFIAQNIAGGDAAKSSDILAELLAHLIPNAHPVATGIIGLTRAQEKGFAYGGGG